MEKYEIKYKSKTVPYPTPFLLGFSFAELSMYSAYNAPNSGNRKAYEEAGYGTFDDPINVIRMALEMRELGQGRDVARDEPRMREGESLVTYLPTTSSRKEYEALLTTLGDDTDDEMWAKVIAFFGSENLALMAAKEWTSKITAFDERVRKLSPTSSDWGTFIDGIDPLIRDLINAYAPSVIAKARNALQWLERLADTTEFTVDARIKMLLTQDIPAETTLERDHIIVLGDLGFRHKLPEGYESRSDGKFGMRWRAASLLKVVSDGSATGKAIPDFYNNLDAPDYNKLLPLTHLPRSTLIKGARSFFINNILSIRGALKNHLTQNGSYLLNAKWIKHCELQTKKLLSTLPVWPTELRWNDGLYLEPVEETNVDSWPVSTLYFSNQTREILHPTIYDVMPCARTAIVSLLASLDYNPCHQIMWTTAEGYGARTILPYSVVIYVNDPSTVGLYRVFAVHAIGVVVHVKPGERDYGRRYLVCDTKAPKPLIVDKRSPFEVEDWIFNQLYVGGASDKEHSPVMSFRVIRLQPNREAHAGSESTEALKQRRRMIMAKRSGDLATFKNRNPENIKPSATISLARQTGNSCTSYASMFALMMHSGYDKTFRNSSSRQVFKNDELERYKEDTLKHYTQQLKKSKLGSNDVTAFQSTIECDAPAFLPSAPKLVSFGLSRSISRSCINHDIFHPYIAQWGRNDMGSSEIRLGDPTIKTLFDETGDTAYERDIFMNSPGWSTLFESLRGPIEKRLMNLVHAPMMISYDHQRRTYRTLPVSIGITRRSNHSVMMFLSESSITMKAPGETTTTEPRKYFYADSMEGTAHIFDTIFALEEYIVSDDDRRGNLHNIKNIDDINSFVNDVLTNVTNSQRFDCVYYVTEADAAVINERLIDFVSKSGLIKDETDFLATYPIKDALDQFMGAHTSDRQLPRQMNSEALGVYSVRTVSEEPVELDIVPVTSL